MTTTFSETCTSRRCPACSAIASPLQHALERPHETSSKLGVWSPSEKDCTNLKSKKGKAMPRHQKKHKREVTARRPVHLRRGVLICVNKTFFTHVCQIAICHPFHFLLHGGKLHLRPSGLLREQRRVTHSSLLSVGPHERCFFALALASRYLTIGTLIIPSFRDEVPSCRKCHDVWRCEQHFRSRSSAGRPQVHAQSMHDGRLVSTRQCESSGILRHRSSTFSQPSASHCCHQSAT